MLELPDRQPVDVGQLALELSVLNLPGFTGVARLSRRPNAEGVWERVEEPYILVKCGCLTQKQKADVQVVVDAHVPLPPEPPAPTKLEELEARIAALEAK